MKHWIRFVAGVCCLVLVAGCAEEKTAPGNGIGAAGSTTGPTAEVPTAGEDVSAEETLPDGNTEPPLSDVTDAVADVPAADAIGDQPLESGEVQLTVVTPDEFDTVIAEHKGKVVMVDFWATWCVPCRKSFPETVALGTDHADDGLVVITMCFDDPEVKSDVLAFLTEHKATGQNLMCSFGGGDESFDSYDIGDAGLPYYRVYDRDGSLKKAFMNDADAGVGVDPKEVHALVEELLATGE